MLTQSSVKIYNNLRLVTKELQYLSDHINRAIGSLRLNLEVMRSLFQKAQYLSSKTQNKLRLNNGFVNDFESLILGHEILIRSINSVSERTNLLTKDVRFIPVAQNETFFSSVVTRG